MPARRAHGPRCAAKAENGELIQTESSPTASAMIPKKLRWAELLRRRLVAQLKHLVLHHCLEARKLGQPPSRCAFIENNMEV